VTVWYRGTPVGHLRPDGRGGFLFSYTDDWINRADSFPVSLSVPLEDVVDQDKADAYFSNLLPEGPGKERLCRQLGISPDNRYEMLKAIGGDCAGALVIGEHIGDAEVPRYEPFGDDELARLVRDRPALPVLADGEYARFSLAGSASKWAVVYRDGGLFWPRGAAPSTHILKVYDPRFSHAPCNEAFVAFLAARLGLSVAATIPSDTCLLIERYDRTRENGISVRLHQEDAAQALGVHAFRKYQREGGVGIAQVLDLIRTGQTSAWRRFTTWYVPAITRGWSESLPCISAGPRIPVTSDVNSLPRLPERPVPVRRTSCGSLTAS